MAFVFVPSRFFIFLELLFPRSSAYLQSMKVFLSAMPEHFCVWYYYYCARPPPASRGRRVPGEACGFLAHCNLEGRYKDLVTKGMA